jgi:hypothetical protein
VDNTPPKVSAKFYKAVVQSVLLYGSKTWNLMTTTLAWLEGFHICAAYRMAEKYKPRKGPNHGWVYPRSSNILQECGMWECLTAGCKAFSLANGKGTGTKIG